MNSFEQDVINAMQSQLLAEIIQLVNIGELYYKELNWNIDSLLKGISAMDWRLVYYLLQPTGSERVSFSSCSTA